ncbi:MAG: glycosyltransferase family 39 protein [Candidatus Dormibacteraeota bacterium]|uniref:Glycosyltransferase family 39 protein n=1 Tax=Candidatus Dormiibacter inghamiae TaxID=3127013 RepID=A0A934KFV2_9BACT|nr:glycosyltransferase family 39 protein [Candidatus Dormibacteraeota bacterium]MBJ7605536.1 glycosyltransferase family 39 protein [Candidatus Dormibacteraeota bacterium]
MPPSQQNSRLPTALLFGAAAAGVGALHLATNGTLGFHTDELYYLACGRHPALGYVDFPPVVPLLARLETGLLGVSPWTLRLLPSLLGGFLVALSGAYVRRLGGSLRRQGIALLTAIAAPYLLGANWVFQTVTFDQVTWMVSLYWFLCLVIDRRPRYWIYLGITLGIGLEVKYTIVGLIAGIGIAVLLTPWLRMELRTKYPWLAVAIALLIWAPNLVWQVVEGFPSLIYVMNHRGSGGGTVIFLIEFVVYLFFLLPVWLAGMVSLFRTRLLRPIGISCAVPLLIFLFVGKSYYAAATVPIALAQGLMAISQIERRKPRLGLEIAVVVATALGFVVFFQLLVPITPPNRLHAAGLDVKNEVFADSVGWADISNQVTTIYGDLPASERRNTVIISAYVGVPGAIHIYGNPSLLPDVVSPQLSYFYWVPNDLTATDALMVDYQPSRVAWMCRSPKLIAHLTVPYDVVGLEQGAPVTFCQLKAPIPKIWGQLRNFS